MIPAETENKQDTFAHHRRTEDGLTMTPSGKKACGRKEAAAAGRHSLAVLLGGVGRPPMLS